MASIYFCDNLSAVKKQGLEAPTVRSGADKLSADFPVKRGARGYYKVIQSACNGYSQDGWHYDGKNFKVRASDFATDAWITAERFNHLIENINRELDRRADCTENDGVQIEDSNISEDRGEWYDDDFDVDHLGVSEVKTGEFATAKQANQLIDSFLAKIADGKYRLGRDLVALAKKGNFVWNKRYEYQSLQPGEYVKHGDLLPLVYTLTDMQEECACYTDCNGYAVCTCYTYCSHY